MGQQEGSEGIRAPALLMLAAISGFVISNSQFSEAYNYILNTKIGFNIGPKQLIDKSVLLLINDGLMAIFFLFVGLELKREVLVGELSNIRQAMLPIFAAIGGMLAPAGIYMLFNMGSESANGWAIPMATDIAFALGIIAILGKRVPAALKVMLVAIAIVDDLGAILVIAMFYTSQLDTSALLWSFAFLGACFAANRFGVMRISIYMALGLPAWYFMLKSGVHATISGVLLAATIPLAPKKVSRAKLISDIFNKKASPLDSPGVLLEKQLYHWVGYFIVPVFALANSGVYLGAVSFGSISMGVILGLVLGKPLGVVGGAYLANLLGVAKMPSGCNWYQLGGVGFLAGIGFTMSLFISSLAFANSIANDEAKLAILIASLVAGSIGSLLLLKYGKK